MNYYRKVNRSYCEILRAGYGRMLRQTTNRKCIVKKNVGLWFLVWSDDLISL
jgi:hypothetical protein